MARYDAPLIANRLVYGNAGLGIRGSVIRSTTATGTYGPGLLYNDWDNASDDNKEFRALVVTPPGSGNLFVYEDGSFTLTGASSGLHTLTYRLFVDGADLGLATAEFTIGATVYRPGADVSGSWTPVGAASVAASMADASNSTYGQSSGLNDPQVCSWTPPLPAGSHDISVTADKTLTNGQLRIVFLDAGNASVGATTWQALTGTATVYTLPVITSATSTNFRIEVQP